MYPAENYGGLTDSTCGKIYKQSRRREMKKFTRLFNLLIVTAFLLGACNLPKSGQSAQGGALTAAAQTMQAQLLTLTALAPGQATLTPTLTIVPSPPATLTPIPPSATVVASATPTCDLGKFISDVSFTDGTIVTPGQAFTKTWKLQNIGACAWLGYSLVFDTGDAMGGAAASAIPTTVQNGYVDVSVNLTAPATPGTYRGYWRIRNAAGNLFPIVSGFQGKSFYVDIKVQITATATGPTSTGTPPTATSTSLTPSPTNTTPIVFAVTSVGFNVTGTCGSFHATVGITVNGAGTVNFHKIFSDGGTDSTPGTMTFTSAGTQSFTFDNTFSTAGSSAWIDIYIDSPNHQQFGRATFTCP
jgi:hypothetical protein